MPVDLEKLIEDLLSKQAEVLETIRLRKGDAYADALAVASETMAVIWHLKGQDENGTLHKFLDHASQCVLMIGTMTAFIGKRPDDPNEQAKLLLEFTDDVKSLSRHMVQRVTIDGESNE